MCQKRMCSKRRPLASDQVRKGCSSAGQQWHPKTRSTMIAPTVAPTRPAPSLAVRKRERMPAWSGPAPLVQALGTEVPGLTSQEVSVSGWLPKEHPLNDLSRLPASSSQLV
jgi:hypothetical protein